MSRSRFVMAVSLLTLAAAITWQLKDSPVSALAPWRLLATGQAPPPGTAAPPDVFVVPVPPHHDHTWFYERNNDFRCGTMYPRQGPRVEVLVR